MQTIVQVSLLTYAVVYSNRRNGRIYEFEGGGTVSISLLTDTRFFFKLKKSQTILGLNHK